MVDLVRVKSGIKLRNMLVASGFVSSFDWAEEVRQERIVIGFFEDGAVLGLVSFKPNYQDLANEVFLLEVHPDYRRRKIGTLLLATVMDDAFRRVGFEGTVYLKTKTNGVQKFYEKLGGILFRRTVVFEKMVSLKIVNVYLKGNDGNGKSTE